IQPPALSGTGATDSITLVRFAGPRRSRYQVVVQESVLSQQVMEHLLDPEDSSIVSAAQAISDLVDIPVGNRADEAPYEALGAATTAYQRSMREGNCELLLNVQVPRINADTRLRLKGIPEGGNHRDLSDELLNRYLTGQRWGQDNGTGRLSRR